MGFRDFTRALFGRQVAPIDSAPVPGGQYGFGAPLHIAYTYKQPPTGDSAKYVLNSYAVPRYSPIGAGTVNQRQIKSWPSSPVLFAKQGVLPTTAANPGVVSGQIVTQGLMDLRDSGNAQLVIHANSPMGRFDLPHRGIG